MTFPRVDAGAAARPASVGWFGVVAQSDPFLEALSAGATARSPFLPVGVAPVDCWRKTDDGHLESRPLKMREKNTAGAAEKNRAKSTEERSWNYSDKFSNLNFIFRSLCGCGQISQIYS